MHKNDHQPLEDAASTEAEVAHERLTRDIIRGELAPDSKLRIRELTQRYGIGASPMREALARLSGRDLVRLEGQKGFRVAPAGRENLIDIARSRQVVEPEVLDLAMRAATDEWEADLLRALHLLERELGRRGRGSHEWLDSFEQRHHDFHRALLSACPVQKLKQFCDDLYVQSERYRRILFGYQFETRDLAAEHHTLVEAALSGDVRRARKALAEHIGLTDELLGELLNPVAAAPRRGRNPLPKPAQLRHPGKPK